MKKNTWLILLASLAFAGCQDNTAPEQASAPVATEQSAQDITPAESAKASSETPAPENPSGVAVQPAVESEALKVEATDAVAVTKPEKSSVAATVQQSMAQADPAVTASDLVAESKTTEAATAGVAASKVAAASVAGAAAATVKPAASAAAVAKAAIGDVAKGKSLARKCQTCHNFTARKKVGPGLKGVFGRKAGAMPDMKYGATLAVGGWVWDEKNLAAWVCDSRKAAKSLSGNQAAKTKMPPQRICDAGKQADLIAFLKTL